MNIVELSGGVGGARMGRGLAALEGVELTIVVNVGDDAEKHGMYISPDLDTVVYTLAGVEGPQGWGRRGDTFTLNDELGRFGVDNRFLLGDLDLALKLFRTHQLPTATLSKVTEMVVSSFDLKSEVIPVTDDRLRTMVRLASGWVSFQEYFVDRRHRDEVLELHFEGAATATPAPGVIEAISSADLVVIGPSNPPLSIWPILSVPGVKDAIADHSAVTAVSPLIGGKAVRGPADRVMVSLGMPAGNEGVAAAYDGLIDRLVIDIGDLDALPHLEDIEVLAVPTSIEDAGAALTLAKQIIST